MRWTITEDIRELELVQWGFSIWGLYVVVSFSNKMAKSQDAVWTNSVSALAVSSTLPWSSFQPGYQAHPSGVHVQPLSRLDFWRSSVFLNSQSVFLSNQFRMETDNLCSVKQRLPSSNRGRASRGLIRLQLV